MFDIGGSEFLLLMILGLLVFGPRKLPELGRQFGGFVAQMRKAMNDFKGTLDREVALDEVKEAAKQVSGLSTDARRMTRELMALGPPPPADPTRRARAASAERPQSDNDASDPASPAGATGAQVPEGTKAPPDGDDAATQELPTS